LTKALKDEDPRVRAGAAQSLGQIGPEAEGALSALNEALKDEDARVRDAATWALSALKSARSHR
jgi:HEAT repeat protein